jgi:hypothetical protein
MTIGSSIVLIGVGAILKWAVTAHLAWIDLQTTGTVLFVLGLVGLALAIAYTFLWSPRANDPRDDTRVMPPHGGTY